ncbi:unnamed protein product [Taenia asiatica]|uniref:Uncharacterized protein n=1 Tax=Taenia asiatica TaxID=60517 RepID=A0A0R3VYW8_TAEAS|nr:unnamed protein product [Taenia asiatica]
MEISGRLSGRSATLVRREWSSCLVGRIITLGRDGEVPKCSISGMSGIGTVLGVVQCGIALERLPFAVKS